MLNIIYYLFTPFTPQLSPLFTGLPSVNSSVNSTLFVNGHLFTLGGVMRLLSTVPLRTREEVYILHLQEKGEGSSF